MKEKLKKDISNIYNIVWNLFSDFIIEEGGQNSHLSIDRMKYRIMNGVKKEESKQK